MNYDKPSIIDVLERTYYITLSIHNKVYNTHITSISDEKLKYILHRIVDSVSTVLRNDFTSNDIQKTIYILLSECNIDDITLLNKLSTEFKNKIIDFMITSLYN